jgi:hypothetical protein
MTEHDDIRTALHDAAARIEVGDAVVARADVRAAARHRRNRFRLVSGLAAVAVVAGGAVTVMSLGGDDGDERLVGADATVVEPDDETDAPSATGADGAAAPTVQVTAAATLPFSTSSEATGAPSYVEWTVPWKDGFLTGSTEFPPQPLPAELPEDVVALFPPEVVELFQEDRPATIDESIERLEAAGLLDEVQAVLADNPAASEAIYGAPATEAPTIQARFTTDGSTWEPVEMTLPPGATYLSGVTAVGDRLAVAYGLDEFDEIPEPGTQNTVRVAVTSDLVAWDVTEIVVPVPDDLPAGVQMIASPGTFAATENGWLLTVGSGVNADLLNLLPDDVRADLELRGGGSLGYSTDDDGATFDVSSEDGTTETVTYTWEELGIAPELVDYAAEPSYQSSVWAAPWGGTPQRSPSVDTQLDGMFVATDAGFLQWSEGTISFSVDGLTWTPATVFPDRNVTTIVAFDGGVLAAVNTREATEYYRLDPTGQAPERLDIDGLPDGIRAYSIYGPSVGGALVLDASEMPQTPPLVVEHEGFRATFDPEDASIDVVEVATGTVRASGSFTGGSDTFTVDADGLTVTDPSTGEVIVVFPTELLEASEEEQALDGGSDGVYVPDLRILATADGERFLFQDIEAGEYGTVVTVANGNRLLVQTETGTWSLYDLP